MRNRFYNADGGGQWKKIAIEGQKFTINGTQKVRYGIEPNWTERVVTGGGDATNDFFGIDPAPQKVKEVQVWEDYAMAAPQTNAPVPSEASGGKSSSLKILLIVGGIVLGIGVGIGAFVLLRKKS